MNRFVALSLVIVATVAGVMLTCRPPQPGMESLESMSLLDAAATLQQEAQKRIELNNDFLRVEARIAQKRDIAWRVIDNKLSLCEAATLFRNLIADCPYAHLVYDANEGASEDERIYRDVIGWVEGELAHDPMRAALEVARLEEEMKCRFP